MRRFITYSLVGTTLLVITSFGLAFSHEGKEEGVDLKTSISMEQAIQSAKTHFPGKVLEAELESEDGKAVYEIEIVNASGESREIEVDAQTGKVLDSEQEESETEREHQSEKS